MYKIFQKYCFFSKSPFFPNHNLSSWIHFVILILSISSVLSFVVVGFYPSLCTFLYPACGGIFISLWFYNYEILKSKKQATIKAYIKPYSFLYRYFSHFLFTKILSFFVALFGGLSLIFTLLFPSRIDVFLFCLLIPFSIYSLRVIFFLLNSNISEDFAPILARKYTAVFSALCACTASLCYEIFFPHTLNIKVDVLSHYNFLLEAWDIQDMKCILWQNIFSFILLKKAIFDVFYAGIEHELLRNGLRLCMFGANFICFFSFSLLCVGFFPLKRMDENKTKRAFYAFFATLFFLIFTSIALVLSSHLQALVKTNPDDFISTRFLKEQHDVINMSIQGTQNLINISDIPHIQEKFASHINGFENTLNEVSTKQIDEYLAKKEEIIDAFSKWYFSIYGEYTRLFYAAIGKGEDLAREQFVFLLKSHTPYDLQEHLKNLYDENLRDLHARLAQSVNLYSVTKNKNVAIKEELNFDYFFNSLDMLNPRTSDKISSTLGLSIIGALVLKSSGKIVAKGVGKSSAKLIAKGAVKKGASATVASSSVFCGAFAPLCAIGLYVASDYAINSVDEALNEEEFKQAMREGINTWEIQLKHSLISYNCHLSNQVRELIPLPHGTSSLALHPCPDTESIESFEEQNGNKENE